MIESHRLDLDQKTVEVFPLLAISEAQFNTVRIKTISVPTTSEKY